MKFLFVYFISLFFFSLTYSAAPEEFTSQNIVTILAVTTGVVALQAALSWLLRSWPLFQNLLLAAFCIANILTLNLMLNEKFIELNWLVVICVLAVGVFIIFTLMKVIDENKKTAKYGLILPLVAIIFIVGNALLQSVEDPTFAIKKSGTSAENIKLVEFVRKPNVYVILFDSLIPKTLMQKYMGVSSVAYHEVLDDNFMRFKNFFAERVPTRRSLNRLLALDSGYYRQLSKIKGKPQLLMFQGLTPSPLFQIFKHNGYETNTIYNSHYFGKLKGPYLDNYLVNRDVGACEFIEKGLRKYTFYGICNFEQKYKRVDPVDFVIAGIKAGINRDAPQILVSYIYSPGHTQKTFNYKDKDKRAEFVKSYQKKSVSTASGLRKIVSFLSKHDPEAILYLAGDHGPWQSRKTKFKDDPLFFVQDRYAVFGGMYPKGNCSQSFSKPYTDKFMTISQGNHMIIRCLSGGKNAFIKPDKYRLPKKETKGRNRYKDYLYE